MEKPVQLLRTPQDLGIEYETLGLEISRIAGLEQVDEASVSLLDSIFAARELVVHRVAVFPDAPSSLPSLFSAVFKRGPPKDFAVLKASTQSFKDLATRVQWLHQEVTLSAPENIEYQLVLNHIRIIEEWVHI